MNFRARPWRGPQECLALPASENKLPSSATSRSFFELYVSEIREIARETYALLLKNYDSVLVPGLMLAPGFFQILRSHSARPNIFLCVSVNGLQEIVHRQSK